MLRQMEWGVRNGPLTKNGVLLSNYFVFFKILFQFINLLQRSDLMYQQRKCPYSYCSLSTRVSSERVFPCEYP